MYNLCDLTNSQGHVDYTEPKKCMLAFFVDEDSRYEIYDMVTTTIAIMLVLAGLPMQLAYLNP